MISTSFCASGNPRIRPMRASGMPKRAGSAAIRRSQCKASSQPPAMASPWTTAMVACREPSIAPQHGHHPGIGIVAGDARLHLLQVAYPSRRPDRRRGRRSPARRCARRGSSMPSPSRRSIARVHRVALLGAVEGDGGDAVGDGDQDLVGHGAMLPGWAKFRRNSGDVRRQPPPRPATGRSEAAYCQDRFSRGRRMKRSRHDDKPP